MNAKKEEKLIGTSVVKSINTVTKTLAVIFFVFETCNLAIGLGMPFFSALSISFGIAAFGLPALMFSLYLIAMLGCCVFKDKSLQKINEEMRAVVEVDEDFDNIVEAISIMTVIASCALLPLYVFMAEVSAGTAIGSAFVAAAGTMLLTITFGLCLVGILLSLSDLKGHLVKKFSDYNNKRVIGENSSVIVKVSNIAKGL